MFLLDTNVISELRTGKPNPSQAVVSWSKTQLASGLFLSAVTVFELEKGVLLLERRTPSQGNNLRRWLESVKLKFGDRILPYTWETATVCASLHVPDPRPERDAMIAATAIEHKFTVVTRNTADFAHTGVALVNPWLA
jgi:predicted nucleic acid-binding protein